ncbi:MAG: protein YgfX [Methylococcales bacterium]|nr:hypothetical protein [Methylococcaceae bacterium]
MAHKLQPLLHLEVKPSSRFKHAKIAVHFLAITATLSNALPMWQQAMLSMALLGHLYLTLNSSSDSTIKIKHSDIADWEVATSGDEYTTVQILPSTVITTLLIIVHYKPLNATARHGVQTVLIPFDALSEKDFRHLVIRLKTSPSPK